MADKPNFGLTGLAVMGQNLARNVAHKGFPIAVHNRTTEKTDKFMEEHGSRRADCRLAKHRRSLWTRCNRPAPL